MDLEKILGTDTGREAFHKSGRNFDKIKSAMENLNGDAKNISFDPTETDLTAEDVQAAIEELHSTNVSLEGQINDLDANKVTPHLSDVVTDADGAHGLKIESGIFTPVLRGSSVAGVNTYSIQFGTYYKIGNLVFIEMGIRLTAKDANMDGYLSISGLPFNGTANSINIGRHSYIAYDGILKGRVEGVSILLDVCKPNTVSNNLMAGAIANNSDIFISAVYKGSVN